MLVLDVDFSVHQSDHFVGQPFERVYSQAFVLYFPKMRGCSSCTFFCKLATCKMKRSNLSLWLLNLQPSVLTPSNAGYLAPYP